MGKKRIEHVRSADHAGSRRMGIEQSDNLVFRVIVGYAFNATGAFTVVSVLLDGTVTEVGIR